VSEAGPGITGAEQIVTSDSFVPLPGSERSALPLAADAGPVDGAQRVEITLIIRRRAVLSRDLVEGPATLTREQFAEQHGIDPADMESLRAVLAARGLQITESDTGARRVKVAGTPAELSQTFGADLRLARSSHPERGQPPVVHRYREGALHLPSELDRIVLAVLGLDDRPQARPQFRRAPSAGVRTAASWWTGSAWWWAARARWPRCGRR
jgi:kumamolisin